MAVPPRWFKPNGATGELKAEGSERKNKRRGFGRQQLAKLNDLLTYFRVPLVLTIARLGACAHYSVANIQFTSVNTSSTSTIEIILDTIENRSYYTVPRGVAGVQRRL